MRESVVSDRWSVSVTVTPLVAEFMLSIEILATS